MPFIDTIHQNLELSDYQLLVICRTITRYIDPSIHRFLLFESDERNIHGSHIDDDVIL